MPIYEYKCCVCGVTVEVLQKIDDVPPEQCNACGANISMKRVISPSAFHLKGAGWYKTDFKGSKNE